ncbi:hypothetical protein Tco_0975708 [Tanacetum coccineum]|uniref:Uncharacterized protein n=1 Tax=Tanacetum coccineum TaxID=301880 RepID=A0ABQ5EF84_9ASTR
MTLALSRVQASILCRIFRVEDLSLSELLPNHAHDARASGPVHSTTPISDFATVSRKQNAFLALDDDKTSRKLIHLNMNSDGDILILEAFLNNEPPTPIPNQEGESKTCLPHLGIRILGKLTQGINGILYSTKLYWMRLETAVQHQRRVNPKIHDVIKNEVEKLLDAGLIYPISDSPCAPGHVQRCMLAIFLDMVEKTMESLIWMISVFGNSYENCLSRLEKMFCKDGRGQPFCVVLLERAMLWSKKALSSANKISKNGIEVGQSQIDVIAQNYLPPTTVRSLGSFLRILHSSSLMNASKLSIVPRIEFRGAHPILIDPITGNLHSNLCHEEIWRSTHRLSTRIFIDKTSGASRGVNSWFETYPCKTIGGKTVLPGRTKLDDALGLPLSLQNGHRVYPYIACVWKRPLLFRSSLAQKPIGP